MEIFKLFGSIFVDSDKANESISKTDKNAKGLAGSLGQGIKTAAKWTAGLTAGAVAVGGAIIGAANKTAEATDKIDKLSQRLGLSREGFQEWEYVLSQSGVSIDSLQSGMKTLTQRMGDAIAGTGVGAQAFEELGLTIDESMTQEEAFNATIQALQEMEDGTKKAQIAQELFGRSGQELLPLLNSTAASTEELKEKANELGLVLSDETVNAGVEYTDAMDSLKRSLGGIFTNIVSGLMPALTDMATWLTNNMPAIKEFFNDTFGFIGEIINNVKETAVNPLIEVFRNDFGDIQSVTGEVFGKVEKYIEILSDIINDLKDTIVEWVENNKEKLTEIKEKFKDTFGKIMELVDLILGQIKELWEEYGDEIMGVVDSILTAISDNFSNALDIIMDLLDIFINLFEGDWEGVWESAKNLIKSIWNTITDNLENAINIILSLFGTDLATIKETILEIFTNIKETIFGLVEEYQQRIYDNIQAILGFFGTDLETVIGTVTDIFTNVKDTISSIIDGIIGTIKDMIEWVERAIDKINIFKKEKANANSDDDDDEPKVDGSHANGLDYVPFNGYVAELHKGERVLTAQENANYNKQQKGNIYQTINFNGRNNPSPREAARQLNNVNRKLAIEWGV